MSFLKIIYKYLSYSQNLLTDATMMIKLKTSKTKLKIVMNVTRHLGNSIAMGVLLVLTSASIITIMAAF